MTTAAAHPSASTEQPAAALPLVAASVAVLIWGVGPLFVKATGLPGITVATYRLWFAIPVMYVILRIGGGRLTWPIIKVAAPAGALFAVDIGLGFSSFNHTSIANATLIGALTPVLVLLFAGRMFGDHLRRIDFLWFALALAGTAIVVLAGSGGGSNSFFGDALAAGSLLAWTAYFLYVKRSRVDGVPAFAFMTAVVATAAVAITPYALFAADPVTAFHGTDWLWLFCLILGPGAIGHGSMTWATRYINVNVTSLMTLAGPVVSTVGAFWWFHQTVSAAQLGGGALVLCAIAMVLAGHHSTDNAPLPLEAE
ncbi:MAG TPA: DMT family transporter [Acidimicrobiia bacterium]